MAAASYDITIEQGATFLLPLLWKDPQGDPVDLTGYSAKMQVRRKAGSVDPPLLDLSSTNGGITLGDAAGTIVITASATQTTAMTGRTGVYDLELTSPTGVVTRLVEGAVDIHPEVTR